ncbi:MAG: translocation/assembly module TamB domain-containing protein [Alistipes sp.]|nr:translocation/assembly module TamB domain-containing protein [Alistipes sp.]
MQKKLLKVLLAVILSVAGLLVLVAILIYIPPVQRFIKDKALASVSRSTGLVVTIDNFRMRFPAIIRLDNITAIRPDGDTLLRSASVDARIALLPLVRSNLRASGLDLQDTFINYTDSAGTFILRGTLRSLTVPQALVSLKRSDVDLGDLDISGLRAAITLGDTPPDDSPSDTARWKISLSAATLSDIVFNMDGTGGTLAADLRHADIKNTAVSLPEQTVTVAGIVLDTARYSYSPPRQNAISPRPDSQPDIPGEPWTVNVASVTLNDNTARYYTADTLRRRAGFDTDDIFLTALDLRADSVYSRGSEVSLRLSALSFREASGLEVRQGTGSFAMDSAGLRLADFSLITAGSAVRADITAGKGVLDGDPAAPVTATVEARVDGNELLLFAPLGRQLAAAVSGRTMTIDASTGGTLSRLSISNLEADLPGMLQLTAGGTVTSLDDPVRLGGDIDFRGRTGDLSPLKSLIADTDLRNRIDIPPGMTLHGHAAFSPGSLSPDLTLSVDEGTLHLAGNVNTSAERYDINLETVAFPLFRFLPRDSLGIATFTLNAEGSGFNPLSPAAAADLSLVIDRFDYCNYPYTDITLKALLSGGALQGDLHSGSRPLAADLQMEGTTGDSLYVRVTGRVGNADIGALGLSQTPLAVAGLLDANFRMWADTAYAASVVLDTVRINHGDRSESITHAELFARAGRHGVAARAETGDLDLEFMAAIPLDSIGARITAAGDEFGRQLSDRSLDMERLQQALPPLRLDLHAGSNNILHGLLLDNGYGFSTLDVSASTLDSEQFRASVVAQGLQTSGLTLDTLNIWMRRNDKRLEYAVRLRNRPGNIDRVALVRARGYIEDNEAELSLLQRDRADSVGFRLGLTAGLSDTAITVRMMPDDLIFGYRPWTVNTENYFTYDFDRELYADLRLDGDGEHVYITSAQLDGIPQGAVRLDMGGVDIAATLGLFPSPPPAGGILSTDIRFGIAGPLTAVEGEVKIDSASWDGRRIGDIGLTADLRSDSTGNSLNGIRMSVDGTEVLTADGKLGNGVTDIDARLTSLPLEAVNPFLPEENIQAQGRANGELHLGSKPGGLVIEGRLGFADGSITVPIAGTTFTLPSDYIIFRQGQAIFDRYAITAPNGQPLTIDGSLDISDLSAPGADLTVEAENFELVNSQRSDGSDVYGRALTDIDITAEGSLDALRVRGDISVLTGTDVTYTLPDNNLDVRDESQDIVTFISFSDTTAVFVADSAALLRVWGMDMLVNVDIQDNVKATINLSADGNNRAELTGDGTLTYTMNSQGDSRFTGRYTLSGGTVVYNPPVISAKTFTVNDGSYVEWTGDITNPSFNVTATESLRINVESDGSTRSVTFEITVSIRNSLEDLALVFDLAAPSDLAIQNQLQSLSAEERSQQAIALLVYNTYTGPGTTAKVDANNPLNSFIENELNQWARNSLPGVDLSLGVNSVTDSDGNQHTDYSYRVSKSLFDDRVQVTVGGSINPDAGTNENLRDNFVDDITLEYRLSNRDNMFLKAYRYNTQESILEGEVTETGFGFVARKKLNKLKELFRLRRSPEQKAYHRSCKEVKQRVRQAERDSGADPARQQRQDDGATLGNDGTEASQTREDKREDADGL